VGAKGSLLSFNCQFFCCIKYRGRLRACGPFVIKWRHLISFFSFELGTTRTRKAQESYEKHLNVIVKEVKWKKCTFFKNYLMINNTFCMIWFFNIGNILRIWSKKNNLCIDSNQIGSIPLFTLGLIHTRHFDAQYCDKKR